MQPPDRRRLRDALLTLAPWLDAVELGPRSVDAGNCDRCQTLPRVLATCGPGQHTTVCRDCALELGTAAWCDGHQQHAEAALAWAGQLPAWWADAVVLWWVATGELRVESDEQRRRGTRLGDDVLAAIGRG